MIFNEEVLFIHVPKMGGMSITTWLINNLPGPITIALPEMAFGHARRSAKFSDVRDRLKLIQGTRHEDLARAERVLSRYGRRLEDFRLILACVRNPYELEFSYYCHLRKESVRKRRKRAVAELSLARAGDFETFAREAPFFGRLPSGIERYYLLRGAKPDNMHIIRLEEIGFDIPALAPYTLSRFPIPHINRKDDAGRWRARLAPALALVEKSLPRIEGGWRDHLTPATECAIYEKYRYLFSFYPRVGSPADG